MKWTITDSTREIPYIPLKHAFFVGFNGLEIRYLGVFKFANYDFELNIQKFEKADERMPM